MNADPIAHPVRVALVGLGYWGTRLAEAAKITPDIRITLCFARTESTRHAFAQKYGYDAAGSYEEILEDPEIEGVLLITPNRAHHHQLLQAIAAGKHVFIDKPLTATLAEGVEAIKAAEQAGVVLTVDHEARCERSVRRMKEMVAAGALGRLLMVDGNVSTATGLRTRTDEWRANRIECPGGPLVQIGIHLIDNMQYLLGPIARVQGWQRRRYIQAPIDDTTVTLLEFANGMLGYLGSGYASARAAWMRLYGDAAVGVYDRYEGLRVTGAPLAGTPEEWTSPPDSYADPIAMIAELLADFARAVRTGSAPEVGGRMALSNLAVVLAAVRSGETGWAVDVAEMMREAGAEWA